jgi:hypothetical protein
MPGIILFEDFQFDRIPHVVHGRQKPLDSTGPKSHDTELEAGDWQRQSGTYVPGDDAPICEVRRHVSRRRL